MQIFLMHLLHGKSRENELMNVKRSLPPDAATPTTLAAMEGNLLVICNTYNDANDAPPDPTTLHAKQSSLSLLSSI